MAEHCLNLIFAGKGDGGGGGGRGEAIGPHKTNFEATPKKYKITFSTF